MRKNRPHDEFFRYLFSLTDVVRHFLIEFLPEHLLAWLDLETLAPDDTQYITEELAELYSDKVYGCQLKQDSAPELSLVILFEHKSEAEKYPHFQLNGYRQQIWSRDVGNGRSPRPVFCIVLYHGKSKWEKREMGDYFQNLPADFRLFIGNFDYVLVDLSAYSDERLQKIQLGFLASGMLMMKHAKDKTYLMEQFRVLFSRGDEFLKTQEGRMFVDHLLIYYARTSELNRLDFQKIIRSKFSQSMETESLTLYDQIILEGKIEGKIEGRSEAAIEFAKNLIKEMPKWSDDKIADLSNAPLAEVRKIRAVLEKGKNPAAAKTRLARKRPLKKQAKTGGKKS